MTTAIKCETIDKMGWAGLRRISGTVDAADSKFTVPVSGFTPTMVVSVSVIPEEGKAAMAYYDIATKELLVYTATSTKKTSGTVTFNLILMGN